MNTWYQTPGTPDSGTWWWAVEHQGHPAFYLRTFMSGDFRPGLLPRPRHIMTLEGRCAQPGVPRCGTCDQVPRAADLVVFERVTGVGNFLEVHRTGAQPWPPATDPRSCWLCSDPRKPANNVVKGPAGGLVRVCDGCVGTMAVITEEEAK